MELSGPPMVPCASASDRGHLSGTSSGSLGSLSLGLTAAGPFALERLACEPGLPDGERGSDHDTRWIDYLHKLPVPILVSRGSGGMPAPCHAFKVHAAVVAGPGRLMVLGLVHESFKLAAVLALTYLRSHWDTVEVLLLRDKTAEERAVMRHRAMHLNVHLTPMAGNQWVEGGSAGVAIAMTLLWLFTGLPFRQDTAVTGALGLGGEVLAVEGVPFKRQVAAALGLTRLVAPEASLQAEAAPDGHAGGQAGQQQAVEVVGVRNLWDAIRVCMAAPEALLWPLPAVLPAAQKLSRVVTVIGSRPVVIQLSVLVPASSSHGSLVSGFGEGGQATVDHVRTLVMEKHEDLSELLGDQTEFDLYAWKSHGLPIEIVTSCLGDSDVDMTLLGPALLLAMVALFWGSVARLPEGTAVSPGYVLSDQAFSNHPTQKAVLDALDEAERVFQAERIRRWVQLSPGMQDEVGALRPQALTAAGWPEGQVVLAGRDGLLTFIRQAFNVPPRR